MNRPHRFPLSDFQTFQSSISDLPILQSVGPIFRSNPGAQSVFGKLTLEIDFIVGTSNGLIVSRKGGLLIQTVDCYQGENKQKAKQEIWKIFFHGMSSSIG